MIIGLFGTELLSKNYGCAALGLSQLSIVENIAIENSIKIQYYIFSNDDYSKIKEIKNLLKVEAKISIKGLINFRDGIKGLKFILNEIKKCDIIIDLTYGDSFSDIYGFKNFILYSIPKILTIKAKRSLIIGPQTIGPYKKKITKIISKHILKKSKYLCVRDEQSLNVAKRITNRNDIVLTSDLAMEMPFEKKIIESNRFKVGINVSDLLYFNSLEDNKRKYEIVVDYKELINKILNKFENDGYEIYLITHVFSRDDSKGEYGLAKKIHSQFPNTILAPKFNNPIEAKNYMSGLDLFLGSRMHATIGAFSSGVPIIPISYSRKFEGLYGSLNYNYGINLRDTTIEDGLEHIDYCISNYEKMKEDLKNSLNEALKRNQAYKDLLTQLLCGGENDFKENN